MNPANKIKLKLDDLLHKQVIAKNIGNIESIYINTKNKLIKSEKI